MSLLFYLRNEIGSKYLQNTEASTICTAREIDRFNLVFVQQNNCTSLVSQSILESVELIELTMNRLSNNVYFEFILLYVFNCSFLVLNTVTITFY